MGFMLKCKVKKTLHFYNPERKDSLLSLLTATQILEEEKASTFFWHRNTSRLCLISLNYAG